MRTDFERPEVSAVGEIQDALDEGRLDRAQEIAETVLEEYEEDEEDGEGED
ncbi:MAG: hypothetical protein HY237_03060 [Acidobacteria bacterium]|nr:hypothetical protein [Acidobacteriota bacterium]